MKKANKQILIIIAITILVIAGIVIAYFITRKKATGKQPILSDVDENPLPVVSSTTKILQYGSRGEDVKRLQRFLNEQLSLLIWKGYPTLNGKQIKQLSVDGIFGAETQAVVKWYFGTTTVSTDKF